MSNSARHLLRQRREGLMRLRGTPLTPSLLQNAPLPVPARPRIPRPSSAAPQGGLAAALGAWFRRDGIVEVLAQRLEVRAARPAAPLARDDLATPLADALDRSGGAERAARRGAHGAQRRVSGSQPDQSTGSSRLIETPSARSRAASHVRMRARCAAGSSRTILCSSAAA